MLTISSLLAVCLGRLNMNLKRCEDIVTTLKASLDCSGRIELPLISQSVSSGVSETPDGNTEFARGADFGKTNGIEA